MDRFRQKSKKDKPIKYADKEKPAMFITDVKSIKENLKIKEILRTVKMNSSMRIKAPRGSKIMQNKDFNDNDDLEDVQNDFENEGNLETESASTVNPVLKDASLDTNEVSNNNLSESDKDIPKTLIKSGSTGNIPTEKELEVCNLEIVHNQCNKMEPVENGNDNNVNPNNHVIPVVTTTPAEEVSRLKCRERKLSLDHTILTRRQSLSQSEIDLHTMGKSPLERKSSFFRKKMDNFLKNTTAIFRNQSVNDRKANIIRRGSTSISLQSLNEKNVIDDCAYSSDTLNNQVGVFILTKYQG